MQGMNSFARQVWDIITQNNVLNLAGALAILLCGWILALLVRKWISAAFRKLAIGRKLSFCLPEEETGKTGVLEKTVAAIFFWGILLLTILGCLSALNLTEAAVPIQTILEKVLAFLPNVIAAAFLCFAAWFVATALKYLTQILLSALRLDQKIEGVCDTDGRECNLSNTIANVIYWLSWLFFFPAILNALQIQGITKPLEGMFARILNYLPNLAAAAAIAFAGLFAAGFLKKITFHLFSSEGMENAGEKAGLKGFFGVKKIAAPVSVIVYALVAIPVVAAALSALQIEVLAGSTGALFSKILNASGNIFGALLLIFIAWVAGSFLASLTVQLLSGIGFNKLFRTLGFHQKEDNTESSLPAEFAGRLVLAAVLIFAFIAAFEILGFAILANLLREFVPFAARLLLAAAVFLFGIYLSKLAVGSIKAHGWETRLLIFAVRIIILFFAGTLALHCTDIGGPIIETAFTLILGAVAVAFAIAFGIGGRDFAAKKLEEWSKKNDSK